MLASRLALSLTGDCLEIPLFQDALIFSFEINLYIIVFFIYQINKIVTQSEFDIKVGPGASPACVVLFFLCFFLNLFACKCLLFWQNIENFKRWLHLLKNVVRVIHLNVTECPIFPLCLNSIFFAGFFLSVTFFSFYFEDFVSKNQNTRKINDWWNTFLQELPGRVQRLPVHDFWRPTSGRQDAHWSSSGRDRQFLCLEVLKKEDSKIFFNSCKRLHLWSFNFLVFHQKVHVN